MSTLPILNDKMCCPYGADFLIADLVLEWHKSYLAAHEKQRKFVAPTLVSECTCPACGALLVFDYFKNQVSIAPLENDAERRPLETLGLSRRTINAFRRVGIVSIIHLRNLVADPDLAQRIPNVGDKTIAEVRAALARYDAKGM